VIANNDNVTTNVDRAVTILQLGNDYSSIDLKNRISVTINTNPVNGSAALSGTNIIYTPNKGFIGKDSIKYTLCDTLGNRVYCDDAWIYIVIKPIANDDSIGTESVPIHCDQSTVNVRANDSIGLRTNVTSIRIIVDPTYGKALINGFAIAYIPTQGYTGWDNLTYELTVNGITDTATVTFYVDCPKNPCDFPEGFSPNGDGVNDKYTVTCPVNNPNSEMMIFNRWGNEVYHKINGYHDEWDGTYRNEPLPDGTYYYIFKYNDGLNKDKTGFIIVHR
jgi:gliding motility-associated-like protein